MPPLRLTLGQATIRAAPDGDGHTIEGIALPWDTPITGTAEYGDTAESFVRGSFAQVIAAFRAAGRPLGYELGHGGPPVAAITELDETDEGLRYRGRLLSTAPALDYADQVAAGLDGVSIEYWPGEVRRAPGRIIHTSVARLVALAGTHRPAMPGTSAQLREVPTMPTTDPTPTEPESSTSSLSAVALEAAPALGAGEIRGMVRTEFEAFRREIAERSAGFTSDPFASLRAFRTLGEIMAASVHDTTVRDAFTRALADNLTSESPGVMTPGVIADVKGIIASAREGVEAFGREPLDGTGMNVEWPYITVALSTIVGEQATQKTEITTVDVPILKGTTAIKTYAGGSDIAYQLIRRSAPSYLDAYGRILLAAYAYRTNAAFVDAIEATAGLGATVINFATATADQIRAALFGASVIVKNATGAPASFVLASATAFQGIGGALNPQGESQGQAGSARASELAPVLSGLRILYDPNVAAGRALVSNNRSAAWHEDGPFQATDEDVAKLGRNVAYWGLGAAAVYIPGGIVYTATV
jgi:hypothetical protein